MPESAGAGSTRRPTVARNGFESEYSTSIDSPLRRGRSMWIGVGSWKSTSRPKSVSSVDSITSFWTSP